MASDSPDEEVCRYCSGEEQWILLVIAKGRAPATNALLGLGKQHGPGRVREGGTFYLSWFRVVYVPHQVRSVLNFDITHPVLYSVWLEYILLAVSNFNPSKVFIWSQVIRLKAKGKQYEEDSLAFLIFDHKSFKKSEAMRAGVLFVFCMGSPVQ